MSRKDRRPHSTAEQVADATIHVVGVFCALIAVPVLVTLAAVWRGEAGLIAAVVIYGISLIAMLTFSATYNITHFRLPTSRWLEALRRLDHAAIYVKIAGTYTPYAVITGGSLGRWMLIGVWSGAVLGLIGKLVAPDRWERLSVILYLALGWVFAVAAGPISEHITAATLVLIVVGGCLYSIGVIFHLWERLPFQNAIWHLFVLIATFVFYSACMVEISTGS